MSRILAREVAMKVLYSQMFFDSKKSEFEDKEELYDSLTEPDDLIFVAEVLNASAEHYLDITEVLNKYLVGYKSDRLFKVDLAILFLALCELLYIKQTPTEVIVNEAVELAKKYSTEKSPKFINGFLADIIKKAV